MHCIVSAFYWIKITSDRKVVFWRFILSHTLWGLPRQAGMVERSDTMWSTGEGNGKPLQYSCLENRMNSMTK